MPLSLGQYCAINGCPTVMNGNCKEHSKGANTSNIPYDHNDKESFTQLLDPDGNLDHNQNLINCCSSHC